MGMHGRRGFSPWKRQDLGKTYLLILAEPFLQKNSAEDRKELWNMPKSSLYRQLNELEKIDFYYKEKAKIPENLNFFVGLLNDMPKRRIAGIPNLFAPFAFLKNFNFVSQQTDKGKLALVSFQLRLAYSLMQALYRISPSRILEKTDNYFGNHSLKNVCAVLLLVAQANPVFLEQAEPKSKKKPANPANYGQQLKRRGLYLGDAAAEKIFDKNFV